VLWILDSISGVLGPDVFEGDGGDEKPNKDFNNTITDLVEICVGRVAPVGNQARFATASAALASL
jgi:hypothetical protein